jgi:hypothetical protein
MNNIINRVKIGNSYTKYSFKRSNFYLIKWEPKSSSGIHDHNGKKCDFMMLNGCLQEVRYEKPHMGGLYSMKYVYPFIKNTMYPEDGYHNMINYDNRIKYSIHRYYD